MVGKGEYVLGDKSNHASIVEGCLLSQGKFLRFNHKDMRALENRLHNLEPEAGKLIVVDGVFSMEGDIIQLPQLCELAKRFGAAVMVDDAHAIGVLGKNGSGTATMVAQGPEGPPLTMADHVTLGLSLIEKASSSDFFEPAIIL